MKNFFRHDGEKDMGRVYVGLSVIFVLISIVCLVVILRLRSLAVSTEQQASASNATPVVDEIIPSDTTLVGDIRIPADGLTPNEGTTVNLYVRGMVSDQNGCANLDHVDIKVYRSSVTDGNACTLDNNDCYSASIAKAQLVGCTGPGITDATFETSIAVANYVDPTDAGSQYADDTWKAEATVYDALNDSGSLDADFEVRSLGAFSLSADHLDYGTITLGGISPQQSLTFSNTGNRLVNSYVNADDNLKSDLTGFSDILSTAVRYSSTNNFTYGVDDAAIQTTQELWEFNLAQQTDDATVPTVPGYFLMQVPSSGVNGTYSNIVTFTADAPAFVGPEPEILSISQTAVPINSASFTLNVTGTNFPSNIQGRFNGSNRNTVRVDSSHLTIDILSSDLSTAGEKSIAVYNPTSDTTSTLQVFMVAPLTTTCPLTGNNVTISSNCQYDSGTYTYTGTLTINNGVTVTANSRYSNSKVTIVSENIDVQGTLTADGMGYPQYQGPGYNGTTGGYGGNGGTGGLTYGSVTQPTDLGSSSNASGAPYGGGAIKLTASGNLTVAGTITAKGTSPYAGTSGGSIWITAGTLLGSGTVTANGANAGWAGSSGGGGGRIAVYYTTDSSTLISGNKISAYGGIRGGNSGTMDGGAGSVYLFQNGTSVNGDLKVVNNSCTNAGCVTTQATTASQTYDNVTIGNGVIYTIPNGYTLAIPTTGTFTASGATRPSIVVNNGGTFNPPTTGAWTLSSLNLTNSGTVGRVTDLTLANSTYVHDTTGSFSSTLSGLTLNSGGDYQIKGLNGLSLGTVTVNSGGTFTSGLLSSIPITTMNVNSGGNVTHLANSTSKLYQLDLTVNNLTIASGATIDVNGKGYEQYQGPGTSGGTAGYGGVGGSGGATYGSSTAPTDIGSGAGANNNSGGGAVKLTVSGALTVNGSISANGIAWYAGSSGGSVWIISGTLLGSGSVSANGANSGYYYHSGGGGGRVAVYYTTDSSTLISGNKITVNGGLKGGAGGTYDGSPGTIVTAQQ